MANHPERSPPPQPTPPKVPLSIVLCRICNKPVRLEAALTDEEGRTVHGDCYLARLSARMNR